MDDLRQSLRTATRDAHERTEAAFAPFDLTSMADYRAFLTAQACAVIPVEQGLASFGRTQFADWAARCRSEALRHDLAVLKAPLSQQGPPLPPFANDSERFGAVYVLEGSHMGARVMLKQVLTRGDPSCHEATHFLRHGQGKPLWPGFLARLAEMAPQLSTQDAIGGALKTFAFFEQCAQWVQRPSEQAA